MTFLITKDGRRSLTEAKVSKASKVSKENMVSHHANSLGAAFTKHKNAVKTWNDTLKATPVQHLHAVHDMAIKSTDSRDRELAGHIRNEIQRRLTGIEGPEAMNTVYENTDLNESLESWAIKNGDELDEHGHNLEAAHKKATKENKPAVLKSALSKVPTQHLHALHYYNMGNSGWNQHPVIPHIEQEITRRLTGHDGSAEGRKKMNEEV